MAPRPASGGPRLGLGPTEAAAEGGFWAQVYWGGSASVRNSQAASEPSSTARGPRGSLSGGRVGALAIPPPGDSSACDPRRFHAQTESSIPESHSQSGHAPGCPSTGDCEASVDVSSSTVTIQASAAATAAGLRGSAGGMPHAEACGERSVRCAHSGLWSDTVLIASRRPRSECGPSQSGGCAHARSARRPRRRSLCVCFLGLFLLFLARSMVRRTCFLFRTGGPSAFLRFPRSGCKHARSSSVNMSRSK